MMSHQEVVILLAIILVFSGTGFPHYRSLLYTVASFCAMVLLIEFLLTHLGHKI